ncbi:hypothetical protein PV08_02939 [Exophiala spinifera]|uniref:Heterokaryon incompatibility domain-containing protein n=1 Tax=Exophiala spinifera TaxID=91928 RepID=A0A0D2BJ90_9EURO|nr:uncharacterized protein PV08_02939 [Exophiala spinifera]KIW18650.1 hypothetical protein PV08_02939 [Exophiala spinifera]
MLPELPEYVALSHRWGKIMPLTLRKNDVETFKSGMPLSKLPKRFQDAVEIARWMDIDYIWIDSLCIIQDSDADWSSESSKMGDIYANSYCNIAAPGDDSQKGCFADRPIEMLEPSSVSEPGFGDVEKTHILGYSDFWSNSLLDMPLHRRVWVVQEQVLSPRTVHFGQDQIFWECRETKACEAYPHGIPEAFCNWRTRDWGKLDEEVISSRTHPEDARVQPQPQLLQRLYAFLTSPLRLLCKSTATPQTPMTYGLWGKTFGRYRKFKLTC